jgi:hypothetical protein
MINWIKQSFDNLPGGASSKKLTGFWFVVVLSTPVVLTWLHWAYTHDDWNYLPEVLLIIVPAGLLALGINTIEKLKGKTNGTD